MKEKLITFTRSKRNKTIWNVLFALIIVAAIWIIVQFSIKPPISILTRIIVALIYAVIVILWKAISTLFKIKEEKIRNNKIYVLLLSDEIFNNILIIMIYGIICGIVGNIINNFIYYIIVFILLVLAVFTTNKITKHFSKKIK